MAKMKHIFWALPLSVLVMFWAIKTAHGSQHASEGWVVVENLTEGNYQVKRGSFTINDVPVGYYETANIASDVAFALNAAHKERMDEIEYREKSK
jgi:hypothetical protein